jgi:hypothetical protein
MYKLTVKCGKGKECEVDLESESVIKYVDKGTHKSQFILPKNSSSKGNTSKESTESKEVDKCLVLENYKINAFSCYMDSLLFCLFAFPTKFVETYFLKLDIERFTNILTEVRIGKDTPHEAELTVEQIGTVIEYIASIHTILVEINKKFRSEIKEDKCTTLRPKLLKDPLEVLKPIAERDFVFAKNLQEDVSEFLQALLKTFFITTIEFEKSMIYTNTTKHFPEKKTDRIEKTDPFISYYPFELQKEKNDISINQTETLLEIDEYLKDTSALSKEQSIEYDLLKRKQMIGLILNFVHIIGDSKVLKILTSLQAQDKIISDIIILFIKNDSYDIVKNMVLFTLKQLEDFYSTLRNSVPPSFFQTKIIPSVTKYKTERDRIYYKSQQDILKMIIYYDKKVEREQLKLIDEPQNQFIIFNIKRFANPPTKDTTPIEISLLLKISDTTTLQLNQIVVHEGISIISGHYVVYFRCNEKWYKYDDAKGIIPIDKGTFEDLLAYNKNVVQKNCALLIYNNIKPTV